MPAYEYLLDVLKLETQGGVPVVDERDSEGEHHSKVRRCADACCGSGLGPNIPSHVTKSCYDRPHPPRSRRWSSSW